MICLRLAFQNWLDNEPAELETETPTEAELQEYEESEKQHAEMFHSMEQQASSLSRSLGVGKLSDARLARAALNFSQEGVRFAFEGNSQEEDDLVLGSRLPFLLLLSKYSIWIKKNKGQLETLKDFLLTKEAALHAHPEFDEVHPDDLAALSTFKESLGIKETRRVTIEATPTQDDFTVETGTQASAIATPSPGAASKGSRRRISTASSQRSRMSTQSALSPLYEEEGASPDADEMEESPSPQKRRKLSTSLGGSSKKSSKVDMRDRIDEGEEESAESDSVMS